MPEDIITQDNFDVPMESFEERMQRVAKRIGQEHLQVFTGLLRRNLALRGVDKTLFDDVAQTTLLEFQIHDTQEAIVLRAIKGEENRGVDSLGRVVVEFCFVRTADTSMIWPEYSDQDTLARWQFTGEALPRPLMRYFLMTLRGALEPLDGFTADSALFADEPARLDVLRQEVLDMLDAYRGPFGSGESAIDWQAVYEDHRFQQLALVLVKDLRRLIKVNGLDGYLDILEGYRSIDPNHDGANIMQRPIAVEDAMQISQALKAAESRLMKTAH